MWRESTEVASVRRGICSADGRATIAGTVVVSACSWVFFFFQAEDGIRDYKVTGVQTCALPIFPQRLTDGGPQCRCGQGLDQQAPQAKLRGTQLHFVAPEGRDHERGRGLDQVLSRSEERV